MGWEDASLHREGFVELKYGDLWSSFQGLFCCVCVALVKCARIRRKRFPWMTPEGPFSGVEISSRVRGEGNLAKGGDPTAAASVKWRRGDLLLMPSLGTRLLVPCCFPPLLLKLVEKSNALSQWKIFYFGVKILYFELKNKHTGLIFKKTTY